MFGSISLRHARVLAAVPLAFLLIAARTTVSPLPETMIAVPAGHAIGETFIARKGDVVLRAKVYDTEVVTIDAPVSVSIAKFSQKIEAGAKLEPVLAPTTTKQLTGASGRYYCGENQRIRSGFSDAMIGDMFSKYESVIRFCFVDTNDDGRLDHVFLAGAKDKADQGARAIEPTAYSSRMLQPDEEEGVLELRVGKFKPKTNEVLFDLILYRRGNPVSFSFIRTVENSKPVSTYPQLRTRPKKVPYPSYFNNILGASFGVMAVDAASEEVELKVLREFRPQLFRPVTIQVQTIYIYY
jgi:hypothetical protein